VVALGLVAARHLGLDTAAQPVDGASAKIRRVLPDALRRRVEALETTLGFTTRPTIGAPVAGTTVLLLADAIRRRRRVRAGYRSFEGAETRREISPFGLVIHSGRWYLAAYDHVREDMRTFRIDRMHDAAVSEGSGGRAARRLRRRRACQPIAGARPLEMGGGGVAGASLRDGCAAPAADPRGADRPG
jgi:predicted DNA-binding transcriptional regulator YafY